MKKIILSLAIFFSSAFMFSEGSEILLTASLNYDQTDYYYRNNYYHLLEKSDFKIGIKNYNFLFNNDYIGFFEGASFGFLNEFNADLYFGPAFSFPVRDWLKVQGGPALYFSFWNRNFSYSDVVQSNFGLLNEFMLKFEPFFRSSNFANHLSFALGFDFSYSFLCYQYEVTSSYRAFWWLEQFSKLDFNPFAAVSFKF